MVKFYGFFKKYKQNIYSNNFENGKSSHVNNVKYQNYPSQYIHDRPINNSS